MSYPINYPTPQGANVQIFNVTGQSGADPRQTWTKPQGASFVWFTLIGGGGGGANTGATGGGSGAVTNCMVPAFLIPDSLQVYVGYGGLGVGGDFSGVFYQQKDTAGYLLLSANGGFCYDSGGTAAGGAAMTANYFTAMGFFQSVAGQSGATNTTASTTTFLSGGAANPGFPRANYGYGGDGVSSGTNGSFQMQPIICGVGAGAISGLPSAQGGIGCGGAGGGSGRTAGGNGLVVIITW